MLKHCTSIIDRSISSFVVVVVYNKMQLIKSPAAANRSIALFCSVFIDIAHLICFVLISSIYSGGEKDYLDHQTGLMIDRGKGCMRPVLLYVPVCGCWSMAWNWNMQYAHMYGGRGPARPGLFLQRNTSEVLARERKALEKQRRRSRMNMHHDVIQVWHTVQRRRGGRCIQYVWVSEDDRSIDGKRLARGTYGSRPCITPTTLAIAAAAADEVTEGRGWGGCRQRRHACCIRARILVLARGRRIEAPCHPSIRFLFFRTMPI